MNEGLRVYDQDNDPDNLYQPRWERGCLWFLVGILFVFVIVALWTVILTATGGI